ncbi:hypothetical protein [Zoogloea sp.]|uniref:hypothetical protein n=1 Tax=Zoogloea sp. TaxID=49181 RepID=UPI0035B1CC0E
MKANQHPPTALQVNQYHTISSRLVHLDGNNPRHISLERESEIIAALCDNQLIALATDIASQGAMSPLEVMGVIEHEGMPGHFIAVEGNRRTCALILLTDPARAPNAESRNTFKRLAKEAKIPSQLHVFLFSDRAKAQPWIDRRHLGLQGGIGTREWDAGAKTRAATRSAANTTAKANILALRVLERLLALGLLSKEQHSAVPITTLSRYLNNKTRRAILGLGDLDAEGQLVFTHEAAEVDTALHRLVLDALPRADNETPRVHSRAQAGERDDYVGQLASQGLTPSTRLPKPAPPPKPQSTAAETSGSSATRTRSTANPAHRLRLINSSFTVKTTDKALAKLRNEMLHLPIDDHEFAANYLVRAFVERVMLLYFRHHLPNRHPKNDAELAQQCAHFAQANSAPRPVQQVLGQANSDKHISHGLHALGGAVHGNTFPTRRQLIAVVDTWEPALQYMLAAIKS